MSKETPERMDPRGWSAEVGLSRKDSAPGWLKTVLTQCVRCDGARARPEESVPSAPSRAREGRARGPQPKRRGRLPIHPQSRVLTLPALPSDRGPRRRKATGPLRAWQSRPTPFRTNHQKSPALARTRLPLVLRFWENRNSPPPRSKPEAPRRAAPLSGPDRHGPAGRIQDPAPRDGLTIKRADSCRKGVRHVSARRPRAPDGR